jgi:hypothetical protein
MSGFFLETGPIADQTFSNGTATASPTLYVGGSDYSTIFDSTDRNVLTVSPDADGKFDLEFVGFGYSTWNTIAEPRILLRSYYESLGYPNQPQAAILATDFTGMGIPYYLWYQTTNLLYKVDTTIAADLVCDDNNGGICKLNDKCSAYPNLWNNGWSFKIQFTGSSEYLIFPIGALAADDSNGICSIYIQYLDDEHYSQSSSVIFGTLFLQ